MATKAEQSLQAYPVNLDKDDVHRAADYLFWASRKYPGRLISLPLVVKVANAMKTVPRETNKQVEAFKDSNRMGRVRTILIDEYRCEMVRARGAGYRATTDSNDIMDTVAEMRARSTRSANARLDRTLSLIKPNEVTGADRRARLKVLNQINNQLNSPEIRERLLANPDTKK